MENLTRESILEAIQRIDDNPGIIKGRESFMYDLIYNAKRYPPILVLSEANKLVGGKELLLKDFGNSIDKAFKILKENRFIVIEKETNFSLEKDFKNYILKKSKEGSNKANSYLRAIDLLNNILRRKAEKRFKGIKSIYYVKSIQTIQSLYIYILEQQRIGELGIFSSEKPSSYWKNGFYSAAVKSYEDYLKMRTMNFSNISETKPKIIKESHFSTEEFTAALDGTKLYFSSLLQNRFTASLLTKPFVILSGLSGSGKTKLAQAFVEWICEEKEQYKLVPVGADWTNRDPLLGYPNALEEEKYIKPDNGVVDLILHASEHTNLPHFLILDEMNLSHVERYFADFLSVMESNGEINFHPGEEEKSGVPASVTMPDNLFIIGTINVDETTYMFSPKVLDRANVIEFRITEKEIGDFLTNPLKPGLKQLKAAGAGMAESFMEMARATEFENPANGDLNKTLVAFFGELKKMGAEFGYRSAYEIHRLINQLTIIDEEMTPEEKLDIAIMQKLLPKLHGSRRKLCPVLITLAGFCVNEDVIKDVEKEVFLKDDFDFKTDGIKYPMSLEKIARMHKGAVDNGFASYAEA